MERGRGNEEQGTGEMRDSLEGILSFDLARLTVPPSLVAEQVAACLGGRAPGLQDPALQRLLAQASGLRYTVREAVLLLPDSALQRELGCQVEEPGLELDGRREGDPWPGALPLPGMEELLQEAGPGRG